MTVVYAQQWLFVGLDLCAIGLFAAASVTDIRERTIPNYLVLTLVALALSRWLLSGDFLGGALATALGLAALAGGFAFYALRIVGAGDAKLFAAAILWFGSAGSSLYCCAFAGLGILLAIYSIATRRRRVSVRTRPDLATLPKAMTLPYGVAIGGAGILAIALGG